MCTTSHLVVFSASHRRLEAQDRLMSTATVTRRIRRGGGAKRRLNSSRIVSSRIPSGQLGSRLVLHSALAGRGPRWLVERRHPYCMAVITEAGVDRLLYWVTSYPRFGRV